jgi:hypothetical protein
MEQQNKYYTPSIEELHVGYECQIGNLFALSGSSWEWAETKPLKWSTITFIAQAMIPEHLVYIRTKYLDQSDIESCGWTDVEVLTDNTFVGYKAYKQRGLYPEILIFTWWNNNMLQIESKIKNSDNKKHLFRGECKSINELRKIMQLVGIS